MTPIDVITLRLNNSTRRVVAFTTRICAGGWSASMFPPSQLSRSRHTHPRGFLPAASDIYTPLTPRDWQNLPVLELRCQLSLVMAPHKGVHNPQNSQQQLICQMEDLKYRTIICRRQLTALPRPLAGREGACYSTPRTQLRSQPLGSRYLTPHQFFSGTSLSFF